MTCFGLLQKGAGLVSAACPHRLPYSVYNSDPLQAQGDNTEKPPSLCHPARAHGDR